MLSLKKTSFNKEAIKTMSFKDFEKAYKGKFKGDTDLKKLFISLGGRIKND